ncbi:hypothetical protein EDB92DRAFT_1223467 [Lactarius akahatsu]|uniref:Uncharacterized protein n=1 Tax=Lactarius akahatsu TaxID=416441 RepID=A0AAD4LGT7_9AGAM|nr:hypothetical protein EDB92DRAFT_1223467 [Lactarius akahatsu]
MAHLRGPPPSPQYRCNDQPAVAAPPTRDGRFQKRVKRRRYSTSVPSGYSLRPSPLTRYAPPPRTPTPHPPWQPKASHPTATTRASRSPHSTPHCPLFYHFSLLPLDTARSMHWHRQLESGERSYNCNTSSLAWSEAQPCHLGSYQRHHNQPRHHCLAVGQRSQRTGREGSRPPSFLLPLRLLTLPASSGDTLFPGLSYSAFFMRAPCRHDNAAAQFGGVALKTGLRMRVGPYAVFRQKESWNHRTSTPCIQQNPEAITRNGTMYASRLS